MIAEIISSWENRTMNEILLALSTAAKTIGISPSLLIAVCMTETNLKHVDTLNDGPSTSYGVCQIKLETAQFMGKVHKIKKIQSFEPEDMRVLQNNTVTAALYLKYQIDRYEGDVCKAIAAYNAGSYKESKDSPGKPFNIKYVDKVVRNLDSQNLDELTCEGFFDVVGS